MHILPFKLITSINTNFLLLLFLFRDEESPENVGVVLGNHQLFQNDAEQQTIVASRKII